MCGIINLGVSDKECGLYATAILDQDAWGDTSADSNKHPDICSEKYKVMIEFMNVDCETTDEYGRPQCPNSEKVGTIMREFGTLIDFTGVQELNVFTTPSNKDSQTTDTYQNYLNGFKRVVSKHLQKIPEYRKEHPGFKLGFAIMDYTLPYYSCESEEAVKDFEMHKQAVATFHKWANDRAFTGKLLNEDLDFVIWHTPFKVLIEDGKNQLPSLFFINPRSNIELIDYDPDLMIFDPFGDGSVERIDWFMSSES